MYKKTYATILILLILAISVFHNYATIHFIYWQYLWTDLVVHYFSGLWVALAGFFAVHYWLHKGSKTNIFLIFFSTIICAVLVGVFWEIFEFGMGIVLYSSQYVTDTLSDILMDFIGGASGFLIIMLLRKKLIKNIYE